MDWVGLDWVQFVVKKILIGLDWFRSFVRFIVFFRRWKHLRLVFSLVEMYFGFQAN